jgi:predicted Zn-dependent protease
MLLELNWIAHRGRIYRLESISSEQDMSQRSLLRASAESFRPLRATERRGIRERRLFVVSARPGESLAAVGKRTGNEWSPEQTAVANGLRVDARLEGGRLLKIARERAYRGR